MAIRDIEGDAEDCSNIAAVVEQQRVVPVAVMEIAVLIVVAIGGDVSSLVSAGHALNEALHVRHIFSVDEADLVWVLAEDFGGAPAEYALGASGPVEQAEVFVPLRDHDGRVGQMIFEPTQ